MEEIIFVFKEKMMIKIIWNDLPFAFNYVSIYFIFEWEGFI